MITGDQCRAGRALLKWSLAELAQQVGIREQAISKFENGETEPMSKNIRQIQTALEEGGVEFLPTGGVQPRQGELRVYKGRSGFLKFIWDVYETARTRGGEIFVSNVNESDFEYWLGDQDPVYVEKMNALDNIDFKVILKAGDTYTPGPYIEYRWAPEDRFSSVPFYVYGDKLAIILFKEEVSVYVIEEKDIADAQRAQFALAWDQSHIPVLRPGKK